LPLGHISNTPSHEFVRYWKAYSNKFFNKLTEMEKWELEQDLLNSMLNHAWGKANIESSEIQNHKKEISEFFDQLLIKRKVN
jgi:hypothetical protein